MHLIPSHYNMKNYSLPSNLNGSISSGKDFLWENISQLPYFRGVLRAVEARFYQSIQLKEPILDLGCGDGKFASTSFGKQLTIGVDPWFRPLLEARNNQVYQLPVCADGDRLPFPNDFFGSIISNSVLEHIEGIQPVLDELGRVVQPQGIIIFCVPNTHFSKNLSIARFFSRINLEKTSLSYQRIFNRISRHKHCDPPSVWKSRLSKAGFQLEGWWNYFSPHALTILEWGHLFGLPALFCKWLFDRWILLPDRFNLVLTELITRPIYKEMPVQPDGAYTFFIGRKTTT
jgi:SAM-dependent methyltransferase